MDKKLVVELAEELGITIQGMWYMIRRAKQAFPSDFKTFKLKTGKKGRSRTYICMRDAKRLSMYQKLRHGK